MKKKITLNPLWLFLIISLIFGTIVYPYIKTGTAFMLGWDMRTIYSSNFEALRNMVRAWQADGTLPFWNWSSFLGNDFYSSKLFYFNDLYEYFFAFTDMAYTDAIIWMTYLRFLTAGFCFYAYSSYNRHSGTVRLCGSLLWAFCAYNLQIMRDPFFASFIVWIPLYFLAVDRYIVQKKKFFFIFMVFFMFLNSYYLFYMTSLFTVLYFIWRWDREYGNMKDMMKNAVILIGYYIVGFMLSGAFVIPEVVNILSNSRVGERSAFLLYESLVPYLDYLSGLFTPVSIVAYRNAPISDIYLYTTPNHQIMAVYLWAGSVCTLLVPQLFTKKNYRPMNLIILILVSLFSLIPILSSVMHGFSEPSFRWIANVSFLMIAMVLPVLDDPKRLNKKLLWISMLVSVILLAGCTPLFAGILNIEWSSVVSDYKLLLYCIPSLILTAAAVAAGKKTLTLAVIICELCLVSHYTYFGNPTQSDMTKETADRMTKVMGEGEYFNGWSLGLDEHNALSFYRTYIDPISCYFGLSTNYNLNFNIKGTMIYDSTYLDSTNDLVRLDPENVIDYLPWTFHIKNPDILTLVSTKYAVIGTEGSNPFRNGELIGHFANWELYQNLDYINLGKTYTGIMTYDDYSPDMSEVITSRVICSTEDFDEISALLSDEEVQCYDAVADGNNVYAGLEAEKDGFAVFSVPYSDGWTVSINGSLVKTYRVNGGLIGTQVFRGDNDIVMQFMPPGLKTGVKVSAAGIAVLLVLIGFSLFRRKP